MTYKHVLASISRMASGKIKYAEWQLGVAFWGNYDCVTITPHIMAHEIKARTVSANRV